MTLESARAEIARSARARDLGQDDAFALRTIGIDLDVVRATVEETFGPGALERPRCKSRRRRLARGYVPFTPRAKKVLELSLREALRLNHQWIGSEHILLGLLREDDSTAMRVLASCGVSADVLRHRVLATMGSAA